MIKKISLIFLFIVILVLTVSCANENIPQETVKDIPNGGETVIPDEARLVGAWSGKFSGTYTNEKITFALRKDGTGYIITNGYIRTFDYEYDSGTLVLEYDSEGTMLPVTATCRYDGTESVLLDFKDRTLLLSDRQDAFITDGLYAVNSLVGTWSGSETSGKRVTYLFNGDGTGEYFVYGNKSAENITWSANRNILVIRRGVTSIMFEYAIGNDTLSLTSVAGSGAQLVKRVSIIDGMGTDSRLYGTWKLSKIRTLYDYDPDYYSEATFVNDYRLIFSADGTAYETRDNAELYRYRYGTIAGGTAELPDGDMEVLPELFLEQNSNGIIYRSYAVYSFEDDMLLVYGEGTIRVYRYVDDTDTVVPDFGIPSKLVGTWIGNLELEGATGTILITLDDYGTGRLVIESDLDVDYIVSGTSIAFIYKNENRGYIFSLDINDENVKLSYRNGSVIYSLSRVTENGGVWEKFTVDDRLYGSWGSGSVKYVFNDDGTGYIASSGYRYNFNYMAADDTIILNVIRSSSLVTTIKYSYSIKGGELTLDGVLYSRSNSGDVSV